MKITLTVILCHGNVVKPQIRLSQGLCDVISSWNLQCSYKTVHEDLFVNTYVRLKSIPELKKVLGT